MYSDSLLSGHGVQLGEALSEGLKVTGVGLSIVFGVLIILMIVLMLFKVIFYKDPSKKAAPAPAPAPAAPAPVQTAAKDDMDEDELIAVLTAAVAASLNTSTYKLQIKSYRRVDSKKPAWNRAGVRETINSRF